MRHAAYALAVVGLAFGQGACAKVPGPHEWTMLPPYFRSAAEFVDGCGKATAAARVNCANYVQGVVDGIAEGTATAAREVDFCITGGPRPADILDAVLAVTAERRAELNLHDFPAARAIHLYLVIRFPCPAPQARK